MPLGAPPGIKMVSDPGTAIPDRGGRFSISNSTSGNFLITPTSPEIVFVPSNQLVSVLADTINVNFHSYRSNALVLEKVTGQAIRGVFAGEALRTYDVLTSTNLPIWTALSTNVAETSGLFEFLSPSTPVSGVRFYQVIRRAPEN
jgi:hypothetical protein